MDDAELSAFELRRSTVQSSHTCGLCAIDAATTVEHVTVPDTAPRASDERLGCGMMVASEVLDEAERPSLVLRQSTAQGSHTASISVAAVDGLVEGLLVRNTAPEQASEMLGRGFAVQLNAATGVSGAATITGTRIEGSHEVGLLVHGAVAVVDRVVIDPTRPCRRGELRGERGPRRQPARLQRPGHQWRDLRRVGGRAPRLGRQPVRL